MFIDHITVAGPDLEELRAQLVEAGFPTEYGGVHDNRITHMALAGFDDGSYLEIVAPLADDGRVALWSNYRLPRKGRSHRMDHCGGRRICRTRARSQPRHRAVNWSTGNPS